MADSIAKLITLNIVSALDDLSMTYNSVAHTATAEAQRAVFSPGAADPYIEVCGPWAAVNSGGGGANRIDNTLLSYRICVYANYNDEAAADTPASLVCADMAADVVKALMVSLTRGSNALITRSKGYGYALIDDDQAPGLMVYVDIEVQAFIDADDPYVSRC